MAMLQVEREKASYLRDLDAAGIPDGAPAWFQSLRAQGRRQLESQRFPTIKDEDWKYTNITPVLRIPFRTGPSGTAPSRFEDLGALTWGGNEWARLVFVDGRYALEASDVHALPSGVAVEAVRHGLGVANAAGQVERDRSTVLAAAEAHLGKHAAASSQAFVALNIAFLEDVAVVHVPAGRTVDTPIHLVFVAQGDEVASHPRVLIVLERGAAATVIESYVGMGEGRTLSNAVSEIVLGDGAILTHYKLLQEPEDTFHIGTTQVHQERDSVFTSFAVAVGNQLARSELNVTLAAPGADCTLYGLYVGDGSQHVDNHTAIEHAQPHGTSRQLYKGILDGRSRAVFNGKVVVQPGAVATDAQQTNRNLILSDAALVDTKPQLEIRDNDVRCSHGATIGQLDEDQVFYLKSRGMGEHRARSLLTYGFANEVIARMKLDPIRVELDRLLLNRLDPDLEDDELPDAEVVDSPGGDVAMDGGA